MEPEVHEPETVETIDETGGDESNSLRELVLRAYPDIVPELLSGATVAEMLASVPAAQEAYGRVVAETKAAQPAPVPAGGGSRAFPMDVAAMSPALKIREGLRRSG